MSTPLTILLAAYAGGLISWLALAMGVKAIRMPVLAVVFLWPLVVVAIPFGVVRIEAWEAKQ